MIAKIIELIKKYKETILYLIVGVIVAAVNWVVYYVLSSVLYIGVNISNIISWCCAFTLAFFLNKVVVFEKKNWDMSIVWKEFVAFFGSRIFTAVVEIGIVPIMLWMGIDYKLFSIEAGVAKLTGSVLATILNYVLSKFFVFKDKKEKEE